jgi:hypothetical protein
MAPTLDSIARPSSFIQKIENTDKKRYKERTSRTESAPLCFLHIVNSQYQERLLYQQYSNKRLSAFTVSRVAAKMKRSDSVSRSKDMELVNSTLSSSTQSLQVVPHKTR